jgi:uncharacterized glyoxalase superfamily protein PhnB
MGLAMIGDARSFDQTSAPAAALSRAALRLKRTTRRLWTHAQVRLNLAATAPRRDILGACVIPTVRYRDVPKAVDWLTRAFGMQVHRVVADADGAPRYAELTVGAGMLMVAPIEDTAFGKMMVQPDEIGGVETQVCYLCVEDARAHAARATAAGAVVIIDPDDEANKGRGYSCRDPEGHVWNFGVYDPWRTPRPPVQAVRWRPQWNLERGRGRRALAAMVLLATAGTLAFQLLPRPDASAGTAVTAVQALTSTAEGGKPDSKTTTTSAPVTVASMSTKADISTAGQPPGSDAEAPSAELAALDEARKAAVDARAQLATTRGALAKAEREATDARAELAELLSAKQVAERTATEARTKLVALRKTAERARAQAARERARRRAVGRTAYKARRSVHTVRRPPRTWCYSQIAGGPIQGSGRLSGFCKG